ncbi:unnamed protein product [Allacma fusca]|uniref:Uncharacterized protein n=1 Tax=Allacma fusca TaxID=39272 RepID=A0A8J2NZ97_9HEXA|nr:unnamed protein product [Allacma fusca]
MESLHTNSSQGVSMVCPILQSIRQRQDSVSTASVTSVVLKKELEAKQRKLNNAEMRHNENLELYKKWRAELQSDEDRIKQRKAEIDEGTEKLKEQILSGRSRIKQLELEKADLAAEVAEKAKEQDAVELEFVKKKTLVQTVFKDLGAVAAEMQELCLGISSEIMDTEEAEDESIAEVKS